MPRVAGEVKLHELKTWPEPFQAVWEGRKLHEIRTNDRDFRERDVLNLREFDPSTQTYSGRQKLMRVTFITLGGSWGLPGRLCVMSVKPESEFWGGGVE